jgi:hypothetical protein
MSGGHQNRKNNYTLSGPAFTRQYFMTAVTENDYVQRFLNKFYMCDYAWPQKTF